MQHGQIYWEQESVEVDYILQQDSAYQLLYTVFIT